MTSVLVDLKQIQCKLTKDYRYIFLLNVKTSDLPQFSIFMAVGHFLHASN